MRFDPNDYVDVQERITQFWSEYPDGAIRTELASPASSFTEVVFRAEIYKHRDHERPDSVGYAAEKPGNGANQTSWHENCECVPLTVPALTRFGFKHYHQLQVGDEILGYDSASESLAWTAIEKISVFPSTPLVQIGNSRFTAVATANHRWVTSAGLLPWNQLPEKKGLRTITVAAPLKEPGGDARQAARLAWLFTDAQLKYSGGLPSRAYLAQSKAENLDQLVELFGEPTMEPVPEGVREWGGSRGTSTTLPAQRWYVRAEVVRDVLGTYRVATADDLFNAVLGMTSVELEAFRISALMADGSGGVFGKTDLPVVRAVQLAMFLTGHATSPISVRAGNEMTTKPCYVVSQHNHGQKYLSEFKERPLPPQHVWCPTTELGTWVADFNGRFAITGNTSAIGRALANMGAAKSRKDRPSKQEMQKVERNQPAPTRTVNGAVGGGTIAPGVGMTDNQRKAIFGIGKSKAMTREELEAVSQEMFGVELSALDKQQASKVIERLDTGGPAPTHPQVQQAMDHREADWMAKMGEANSMVELSRIGRQIAEANVTSDELRAAYRKHTDRLQEKALA